MKVSFITGGATGIGKATIEKFIVNNIAVGFLDINKSKSLDLVKKYSDDKIFFSHGDVTKIKNIKTAIEKTHSYFGKLDIVFTNAGIHRSNSIFNITEEDWEEVINTNLKSAVFTIKESIPYLLKNGGGKVILMGSDQCFIGKQNNLAYGASKGAIAQITKSLAVELANKNISVNAVCPGTIDTPLANEAFQRWADREFDGIIENAVDKEISEFPVGRLGTSEEIAEMVYFIAAKSTNFTTGSLFKIDGGITAR